MQNTNAFNKRVLSPASFVGKKKIATKGQSTVLNIIAKIAKWLVMNNTGSLPDVPIFFLTVWNTEHLIRLRDGRAKF